MKCNRAWLAMFGVVLFIFVTLSLRGGSLFYYFTYYVEPAALEGFLSHWGLVEEIGAPRGDWLATVLDTCGLLLSPGDNPSKLGVSLFSMLGQAVNIAGIMAARPLALWFGKRTVLAVGVGLAAVVQVGFFFIAPSDVAGMFWLNIASSVAYGPTIPLLWAMMSDTADYSEWKTERRATGLTIAGLVFALKAGLGLGGSLCGWLLAAYGYTPQAGRSTDVLEGIRLMVSRYSAIPFALATLCAFAYPVTKQLNQRMQAELASSHPRRG